MTNNIIQIRPMLLLDIDPCLGIHLNSFPNFFLTILGGPFLRVLYSSILSDSSGMSYVAEIDKKVNGFVVGTVEPNGLYGRLLKNNWWRFGWAAMPALFRQPLILPRLLRAFNMPNQQLPTENCATLMSVAVSPDCQGRGIGKLLVKAFLDEARSRGSQYVNLTTDAVENDAANHFYQNLGFELYRKFTTPEGRDMNEYLIELS